MACFLVTAAEAIVVTAAAKIVKKNERSAESLKLEKKAETETMHENKLPWSKKLMILASLLWGGAFLLCYEHIWHGEVVPFFPFLTAASEGPQAVAEMLGEMASVGVTMAVLVTAVWVGMVLISAAIEKRPEEKKAEANV